MFAFDTDVVTGIMRGQKTFLSKLREIPVQEQAVPVIVIEEIIRGRLNMIRKAESGSGFVSIEQAYLLFQRTLVDFQRLRILPYTQQADSFFQQWRRQKIRVGSHDLRIAAISRSHGATLISRNRRDFERIPELDVVFWK